MTGPAVGAEWIPPKHKTNTNLTMGNAGDKQASGFATRFTRPTQNRRPAMLNTAFDVAYRPVRLRKYECAKPSRNFRSAILAMEKWRKLASLMCIEQSHQFAFHFNKNLFIFWTHSLVSDITCNLCCRRHIIGVFGWFRLHAHTHNVITVAALPSPLEAKINLNRYNFDMRNFIFRLNFRQNYFICVRRNSVVRLRGYRKSNSRTHQHQSVCTAKDVVAELKRNHWEQSPYRKLVYFRRHKQCQLPIAYFVSTFPNEISKSRLKIACAVEYWHLCHQFTGVRLDDTHELNKNMSCAFDVVGKTCVTFATFARTRRHRWHTKLCSPITIK